MNSNATGKLILPNPATKSYPADTIVELKAKYDNLVDQFNALLSAIRIAKIGV